MDMRKETIERILENKLIAIVRGVYGEDCIRLAEALCRGGMKLIEVTFDQANPESFVRTQEAIAGIISRFGDEFYAGAGTVTSTALVEMAHEAGARYIISPNYDPAVIRRTLELDMVSIPGALTASEVVNAHNAGADFVKLFPMANLGAGYLKAVRSPLNHIRFMAVGGVNEDNLGEFMAAGAVGAGIGGNLVNKKWISEGKFDEITALAARMVAIANA